jgi:hypothetical protein
MQILYDPLTDILADAVGQIDETTGPHRHEARLGTSARDRAAVAPAADDEVAIVVAFMDALRCARDLIPGDFRESWYPHLVAKIREAATVAQELYALQTALHDAAAQSRDMHAVLPSSGN